MPSMWITSEQQHLRHWLVPALAATLGVGIAIAEFMARRYGSGLAVLVVLLGYAVHLAYRRSEVASTLSDSYGIGHRARTHLRAAAMTGDVVVAVVVTALIVQALRGGPMGPYAWLAGLAGVTYALSAAIASRVL
ncbi:MAG: binding-protein-dependent transport system inner rane component [Actinomycetia bacterium]|nr:binding-protein-dependent transport system inner rane component [Actinomycetes bacterium]